MTNHFVLSLSGSAQKLSDGLTETDIAKYISIQALAANAHVVYIGGSSRTLTSTDFGFVIPIPASSIPAAPLQITGRINTAEIYVLGTAGEKVSVFYSTW